jgi:hypothetical protein
MKHIIVIKMNCPNRNNTGYTCRQTTCPGTLNNSRKIGLSSTIKPTGLSTNLGCNNKLTTTPYGLSTSLVFNNKPTTRQFTCPVPGKVDNKKHKPHVKPNFKPTVPTYSNRNVMPVTPPFMNPNFNNHLYRPRIDRSNNVQIINPIIIVNSEPEQDKRKHWRNKKKKTPQIMNAIQDNTSGIVIEDLQSEEENESQTVETHVENKE